MKTRIIIRHFIFYNLSVCACIGLLQPLSASPKYAVAGDANASDVKAAKSNLKTHSFPIEAALGDGRTISGKFQFQAPDKLTIRHTKNGIDYTKEIKVSEFSEIEFLKWKSSHVKKSKEGEVYRFNVTAISLKLTDGKSFILEKDMFPFFDRLVIENSNGMVSLFSFWIDLLRPDGTWYTGMSGPVSGNRVVCHKDVIKKITFNHETSKN
ncbi:MAG: hypothetical protein OEZ34_08935 [Spirochaetia bacterium]|nr:hypothetical protein [Spirochaetia bacterium]